MHPDLVSLLAADDEAKQRVADAERRLQERARHVRAMQEAERARLLRARADEVDRLVRTIDEDARRHAAERAAGRQRVRDARSAAARRARPSAIQAYLRIVGGPTVSTESGP
jgi:hypothetical protein